MKFIRRGELLSVAHLHGFDAEMVEIVASPGSQITQKPLSKLNSYYTGKIMIGSIFRDDTWQVAGVSGAFQPNSKILIYDRYGKLLKQLNPSSKGWDGTLNGKVLPNDDYWFAVKLQDGRIFKNHFSLKR